MSSEELDRLQVLVRVSERRLTQREAARNRDFGPTFAHEKLTEVHGFEVSVSTLRTWMTQATLWVPRSQRQRSIHQPRNRRECYGELIQIDGSDHPWFEDRAPRCTRSGVHRRRNGQAHGAVLL